MEPSSDLADVFLKAGARRSRACNRWSHRRVGVSGCMARRHASRRPDPRHRIRGRHNRVRDSWLAALLDDRHPIRQELGEILLCHARHHDHLGVDRDAADVFHCGGPAGSHYLPRVDIRLLFHRSWRRSPEFFTGHGRMDGGRGRAGLAACLHVLVCPRARCTGLERHPQESDQPTGARSAP